MTLRAAIAMALSLGLTAYSWATEPTNTPKAPKPQVSQSSAGCASPNVGENSGRLQIAVDCRRIWVLDSKAHMNSLEVNEERLLLAKNPAEVRITNAYLRAWLPDGGRMSLTLEYENPRDLPIPEIEVDFLDPASGKSIPTLKSIPFTLSEVYREIGTHKFSLEAGGTTALPAAFLDEIVQRQHHLPDMCPYDASVTGDAASSDAKPHDVAQSDAGAPTVERSPLLVRIRLKSIFELPQTSTRWVWIVYGKRGDPRNIGTRARSAGRSWFALSSEQAAWVGRLSFHPEKDVDDESQPLCSDCSPPVLRPGCPL